MDFDYKNIRKIYILNTPSGLYTGYQSYYRRGLRLFCKENKIHLIDYDIKSNKDNLRKKLRRGLIGRTMPVKFLFDYDEHVGQYIVEYTDKSFIKLAIDAHDNREIRSPSTLKWADIYFKSNTWPQMQYPAKVCSIINGNGKINVENINFFRGLRNLEKKIDLTFISRVWGGREHNIKLFEQLSKAKCNKKLLAIFLDHDRKQPETKGYIERLKRAGVKYTFSYEPLLYKELAKTLAESKIVVLRAGKHLCIPWRMLDLLCLGCCVVTDSAFFPEWPQPLVENGNYLNLGIKRPENGDSGELEDYEKIPSKIENFLKDDRLLTEIGKNNEQYFDGFAAPYKIAEYIFSKTESLKI